VTFSRRTETTAITIKPRTTTKATTIWIFFSFDRGEKRDYGGKRERRRRRRERESAVAAPLSLSLSLSLSWERAMSSFLERLFSDWFPSFVRPSVFVYSQQQLSFFLKTQKRRTTRSARRGDETHHETRERNERVGFARVIEGGASRGVLVAATRMAFGVEEFDAQSVAENRVGEIRESTVGVLLRVLSGDFSRVGDRG
jgi:hypothetical protein